MNNLLQLIKLFFTATAVVVSTTTPASQPATAVIRSAMMPLPLAIESTSSALASDLIPGLLPIVPPGPFKVPKEVLAMLRSENSLKAALASSTAVALAPTSTPTSSPVVHVNDAALVALSVTAAARKVTPVPVAATPPPPAPSVAAPVVLSAQAFLDNTTAVLKQGANSLERVTFNTDTGAGGEVSWNLLSTTVGGTDSAPEFNVSSSCLPVPTAADPDDLDQNPWFAVNISYTCTLSLTPLTGTDRRTVSKDLTFQTDPGRLVVSAATTMNMVLQDNQNNGGLIFDNQDTQPITITGLTIDASFTALNTSSPLVFRIADPVSGSSLFDYHLEGIPTDPTAEYTATQTGINVPISLTIPADTSKMVPVEALGVHKWELSGSNPAISITLQGVTATRTDFKTVLLSPKVLWTCTVPTSAYNPYATSSPFLTGQACQN